VKVIVDTSVWSLVLRRGTPQEEFRRQLAGLIDEQRVVVLGPIRQELLSGYSEMQKFELLREKLAYFENEPVIDEDYIRAAEFHNTCRLKGIQGSHTDFLICACAVRLEAAIFTTDNDFKQFCRVLPITLFPETTQSRP
jgi:predicted nucleic acid-binding protein